GTGKAAFWLDNADNLFALRPEDLRRRPSRDVGRVNLALRDAVTGPPARLGVGLPYTLPEDAQLMGELRPQTAGHYSFVNVMARNPAHEQRFRPQYRHRYGIDHNRKSTRLNSSHVKISYAVFCLKKKKKTQTT